MRRLFTRFALFLVLASSALAVTASVTLQAQRRNDNAAFGIPASTGAILADPGSYAGKLVTVSAAVDQSVSGTAFVVDQRTAVGATSVRAVGKPLLVIAPYLTKPLGAATYVMVTGRVVLLTPGSVEKVAAEYTSDIPAAVAARFAGQPVLVAGSVLDGQYAELGRKPVPPATAPELAMSTAMKSIGGANTELRTATQASQAEAVTKAVAAMVPALTATEVAWDTIGQAPAGQWARDARDFAQAAQASATAGNWDAAKASVASLNQTCQACHGAYRERMDDGTFRFKRGTF